MTIEEKAKAYDEALEKAKIEINTKGIGETVDLCEQLFPELRESEDERIRKWLYDLVDEGAYLCERPFATESILAWLEKQKEKLGDISTILLVKKEIERRIETWQKSRKELIAMECNTLADDAAARIEELHSLISFLGTIRCNTNEKQKEQKEETLRDFVDNFPYSDEQKEQKPVKCIDFDNEFENQVSHLLASVLNGEWEYNAGFVKHAAQSLLGYAKNEIKPELPLMDGDTDTYFDDLRMTTKPLTSREWFDEGIKYAQRLQKEQKHNYCLYGGYPSVGRCRCGR